MSMAQIRRLGIPVVLAATSLVLAQESPSYVMSRVTLVGTAGVASSSRFDIQATLAQAVPVGAVSRCNDGFHQSAGIWSVLGEQPVPTILFVTTDTVNPGGVILTWTGSASQFDLYRSTTASSIVSPGNLMRTLYSCTTADLPPAAPRIYYQIDPSGP